MKLIGIGAPLVRIAIVLVLQLILWGTVTHADENPKARLNPARQPSHGTGTAERVELAPVPLDGGGTLIVSSPKGWKKVAESIAGTILATHDELRTLFGEIPSGSIMVQLMDEDTFFLATGAPRWTNALYFQNRIILPISHANSTDLYNVTRSVKHEYSHAAVHALTGGNCPGWLDEGIAQWVEGPTHPAIRKALALWMDKHSPISLSLLQTGFTKLEHRVVPAAYAQSLWMTRYLIKEHGLIKMRKYFELLRINEDKEKAFLLSYNSTIQSFEKTAAKDLTISRSF